MYKKGKGKIRKAAMATDMTRERIGLRAAQVPYRVKELRMGFLASSDRGSFVLRMG